MKTALFVDFDNAYLGLKSLSLQVANRFGQSPSIWLRWLIERWPTSLTPEDGPSSDRRVLIRRCYLNPVSFSQFRRPFLEAGFDIVDCPPMTAAGKTSTDVHMVIDMIDAMQHPTGFEEFVVFSADADFSPVLRRLRMNNRKTAVFAAGNMSDAYRASADVHIDLDTFIYDALGHPRPAIDQHVQSRIDNGQVEPKFAGGSGLDNIGNAIERIVKLSPEPVPLARLAVDLQKQFGNLAASRWLDTGSFSELLNRIDFGRRDVGIDLQGQLAIDLIRWNQQRQRGIQTPPPLETNEQEAPTNGQKTVQEATEAIIEEVSHSTSATSYVRLAGLISKRYPGISSNWLGHKNFTAFVESLELGDLRKGFLPDYAGRMIYDPKRHLVDSYTIEDQVVASIFQASKMPKMPADKLCSLLNVLWATHDADQQFDITVSANRVHQVFLDGGGDQLITLPFITAVLQGLIFGGFDPKHVYESPDVFLIGVSAVLLAGWARENFLPEANDDIRSQFLGWISEGAPKAVQMRRSM